MRHLLQPHPPRQQGLYGKIVAIASSLCVLCVTTIILSTTALQITPCDHLFHEECLVQWADVKLECPVCRSALPAMADDPS